MTFGRSDMVRCPTCSTWAQRIGRVCPECDSVLEPEREAAVGAELQATESTPGSWLPRALVGAVLVVYVGVLLLDHTQRAGGRPSGVAWLLGAPSLRSLRALGAFRVADADLASEWWRVVACTWLHGFLIHLAFNAWILGRGAAWLTAMAGWTRTVVVYLLAAVAAPVGLALWAELVDPVLGRAEAVGASGGVIGLLGAVGVLLLLAPDRRSRSDGFTLALLLGLSFAAPYLGLGVSYGSNVGHGAGLLVGVLFGLYLAFRRGRSSPAEDQVWKLAAFVLLAATVVSLTFAVVHALGALR